ncbi:MAG: hypothetical protein K6G49_02765 [Candidatus Saccharibacteria bacterium]|nr:hypothetical protein [Candidatus Saccharibacteria bacterium]
MKQGKLGFTLVEVSLFLAISGLLFFAITLGVQNSIYQQRKNDSVQSFIEFLRGVYDEVLNVQNDTENGGRSENAIYGKLVVFGENANLAGTKANQNEIFTYSVVGRIGDVEGGQTLKMLKDLGVNVVAQTGDKKTLAGFADSYEPKWSAQIETTDHQQFKGMLLIVRHPNSGAVNTYFNGNVVQINEALQTGTVSILNDSNMNGYQIKNVDFCVNSDPGNKNILRSDVRLLANAKNASGVELMTDEESVCK